MTSPLVIDTPELARAHLENPEVVAAVRRELWFRGDLAHTLRPHGQAWIDRFIESFSTSDDIPYPIVVETHRRLGKSHYSILRAVRRCLSKPWQRFVYGLPSKEMAQQIVIPNLSRVLEYCPKELRPEKRKLTFTFRNPRWEDPDAFSQLDICGINQDPDAARGGGCDEACIDEAGYCQNLDYFLGEVIGPQFVGRDSALLTLYSTPPKSMAHPFISKYIPEAIGRKRYFRVRGSENPDFTEQDKRIVKALVGDDTSIGYRREVECEHLTDESYLILPEFSDACVHAFDWPRFYYPLTAMDLGYYPDYTHVLLGAPDFENQRLLVRDEIWVRKEDPGTVARRVLEKERQLWTHDNSPLLRDLSRCADGTYLELAAFRDAGCDFEPAIKWDADAGIAQLRRWMQEGKVWIHPDCKQLIYQAENGIWNDKRSDWIRNERLGHSDGIKALSYMLRKANFRDNPFPAERPNDGLFRLPEHLKSTPRRGHPILEAFGR